MTPSQYLLAVLAIAFALGLLVSHFALYRWGGKLSKSEYRTGYLRSFRWRYVVRPVRLWLQGDGRCVMCNRPAADVHHATYANRGRGLWAEIQDTTLLCRECHETHHRINGGNK